MSTTCCLAAEAITTCQLTLVRQAKCNHQPEECRTRCDCGAHCAVKNLEYGYLPSDAPRRPHCGNTHTFNYLQHSSTCTYSTAKHRTAPHLHWSLYYMSGPCPGHAYRNSHSTKDAPNAALILLWQSPPQGLPLPQGPHTRQKYTYMRNRRVVLSFVLFLSSYCFIFTRTIPCQCNSR